MSPRLGDHEASDSTNNSKNDNNTDHHPATTSTPTLTSLGVRVVGLGSHIVSSSTGGFVRGNR
jgi:hypothetical protein